MEQQYLLSIPNKDVTKLAKAWLFLGIIALLASGLFSLLLVVSRTPFIQAYIPFKDFFHTAIVVHVDLSVLIWFTAFASSLWSISCKTVHKIDWWAFYLAVLGTIMVVITPFIMDGHPLMNNYIPILQTPFFYFGLGFYTLGLLLRISHNLIAPLFNPLAFLINQSSYKSTLQGEQALHIGMYSAALTTAIALLAFLFTLYQLPMELENIAYFEVLFWGSGHILQFTHMLMMFVVWLVLLHIAYGRIHISAKIIAGLFVFTFIPVLFSPLIYGKFELLSGEFREQFTQLMKFGSLTALPLGAVIFYYLMCSLMQKGKSSIYIYSLWSSLILFTTGGVLGFMIAGANVVIPAHYHGSIVGITLAFMGMTYFLLPLLGYPLSEKARKWAKIQPIVYATGQMMHISGLAWSGGYGVKRKTAGAAQGLENLPEIAGMALMGMGGLVAVIGGFLFLLVCYYTIFNPGLSSGVESNGYGR